MPTLAELRAVLRLAEELPPFRDCGKDAAQDDNFRIAISMKEYANAIDMVGISAQRHKTPKARITDRERSEAESIIGALGWLSRQLRADAAFGYSLMAQTQERGHGRGPHRPQQARCLCARGGRDVDGIPRLCLCR